MGLSGDFILLFAGISWRTIGIFAGMREGTRTDRTLSVASITTTVESIFGSGRMVDGFFLNNHLENFATEPEKNGEPVANALAGGKRPRTAMAPTMVFSAREDGSIGAPFLATGSPGGSEITSYVVKNLVAMLDWGMDPQSAADLRNFGAISRSEAVVETGWGSTDGSTGDDLVDALDGPAAATPTNVATAADAIPARSGRHRRCAAASTRRSSNRGPATWTAAGKPPGQHIGRLTAGCRDHRSATVESPSSATRSRVRSRAHVAPRCAYRSRSSGALSPPAPSCRRR